MSTFSYRLTFEKLKNLKTQIEHSQLLIDKSQVKLQKDFENWWEEQCEIIVIRALLGNYRKNGFLNVIFGK